jgi:hypothetical protein
MTPHPYKPELRSIPLTRYECPCRRSVMVTYNGSLIVTVEPVCAHKRFPWVEFPRGSGFHDPLYCRAACECGKCPRGFP